MSRFYFHVHAGLEISIDRAGWEYPSVEVAADEALGAVERAAQDMLSRGRSPEGIHIEISDENGNLVAVAGNLETDPLEGQTRQ